MHSTPSDHKSPKHYAKTQSTSQKEVSRAPNTADYPSARILSISTPCFVHIFLSTNSAVPLIVHNSPPSLSQIFNLNYISCGCVFFLVIEMRLRSRHQPNAVDSQSNGSLIITSLSMPFVIGIRERGAWKAEPMNTRLYI